VSSTRSRPTTAPRNLRFDIQALRALAVASVVLYHLWPNHLPAGFIGVDIFFVISGYLITSHLFRSLEKGEVRLGHFWSRRAIRLLPSSCLVLVLTGLAIVAWVPRNLWKQFLGEVVTSTLYVQNWNLAHSSIDYLNQDNGASPVQHFWSLSVEEQFYVALPLLLVVILALSKRFRFSAITVARILLLVVVVVSLAYSILETATSPGPAYFSTATRAWEFAAGGVAATFLSRGGRASRSSAWGSGAAAAGLVLLAVSLVVITPALPFPSYVAALPVAGAFLVVAYGGGTFLEKVGSIAPIAFLGRISYALYLWHWPGIVILPFITHHALTTRDKLSIGVAAVVLAWLTTRFLEEPLRFAPRTKSVRPRRVLVLGAAAMALSVVVASTSIVVLNVQAGQAQAVARHVEKGGVPCFGAASLISSSKPCHNPRLDEVVVPDVSRLATDDANRPECWSQGDTDTLKVCSLGPKSGYTKHLFAVGDSHNNALVDAYAAIAKKNRWRIDVAGRGSCYWTTATQQQLTAALTASCATWKAKVTSFVEGQSSLNAVLVTHSDGSARVIPSSGKTLEQTTTEGLIGAWKTAAAKGIPIIAIHDNPIPLTATANCVAQDPPSANERCSFTPKIGSRFFDGQTDAAAQTQNARVVDLRRYLCSDKTCPVVIGSIIVYRDGTHMTRTFISTLEPYLEKELKKALVSAGA
jgi:peptidoglycan/LPS O-acetylase OafA/YrhL